MNKKRIEITIDELGNISVSKPSNLSYHEAFDMIDYARAQLRLNSMQNKETNGAAHVHTDHVYSY